MGFSKDFVWGAAASSYQIEGAVTEDGKGMHIWDVYTKEQGHVFDGHTGDLACDHYHRYEEDVAAMKEMGLKAYRFSIDWSRVLPDGTGRVNEAGIAFYNRLIDALLEHGIEPYITLYHWELPYELYKRGGWMNPEIVEWFGNYAKLAAERFSDRVKHFFTINEPQCFIGLGFLTGEHAPGIKAPIRDTFEMTHNVLKAHGRAVQMLRRSVRTFLAVFVLGFFICSLTGCSFSKDESGKVQNEEESTVNKNTEAADEDENEDLQAEPDEDMVRAPIDFKQLNLADKKEENGISYYNIHTAKELPLPLNEWAKLDAATEKGAYVNAYLRFVSVTRDTEEIVEYMNQYFEASKMQMTFHPQPVNDTDEYVLMKYEILIGKDTALEEDYVSLSAVRFPLQLYSTMRSGDFGDDTVLERENAVMDVSIPDTDLSVLEAGASMEKAVLCEIPKNYTAYGITIPYMSAEGRTQSLCFKLEY